eukprot:403359469
MVGTLVKVIDQETFLTNLFARNYVEFLVEGLSRFKIQKVLSSQSQQLLLTCDVIIYDEENSEIDMALKESDKTKLLKQKAIELCELPRSGLSSTLNAKKKAMEIRYITSPSRLTFMSCSLLNNQTRMTKQSLLETDDLESRMQRVIELLTQEIEEIKKTNSEFDKQNSNNQLVPRFSGSMKSNSGFPSDFMRGGFGGGSGRDNDEVTNLRKKLEEIKLPEEAKKIVETELNKVSRLSPSNQEYHVSINYLQTISDLPWSISDTDNIDPDKASLVLERDHFGLDAVKKRIIQFLAVRKLRSNNQGTILCFYGPPGVGKTSLGKSIAEALGRKFYRIALGGVRDEAEIRGHRRTYVGALPGVIIQSLKKIKTNNPVFLLDEIDKLGRDNRGDPSSAMLEVLDPNQNDKFTDHFLATPFDLSNVFFIATANSLDTIHPALLDRMEVVDISGYSIQEKMEIAKRYLIPKQIKENGITDQIIEYKEREIEKIITEFTMESGVRNLDRAIGSVCRQVAYQYAISKTPEVFSKITVDDALIKEALGNPKYDFSMEERITRPGIAIVILTLLYLIFQGLAYTEVGGRALLIETAKYPGTGQLNLTGKLGDVMKESVNTALSWIKTNAGRIGVYKSLKKLRVDVADDPNHLVKEDRNAELIFKQFDLHVHFPAAAVPKDGPSAGVTITTALVSLLTNRRVKSDFAMTGEISLQGLVLPVGGIKEKTIAAHRNGIKNVILPFKNKKDIDEIPTDVRKDIQIHFAHRIEEVLELALEKTIDHKYLKEESQSIFKHKL